MIKWKISPEVPSDFISSQPELPPTIARLLWNRNIRTQEEIDAFLNPDYSQDIHDPFLFKDMEKAVKLIEKAIKNQEKILVHGDYDADGVCASAVIITCLKKLGAEKVQVFLPHREKDGYGLNIKNVKQMIKQKVDLIITCDCGITNIEEISLAKKNGIKVIITDHHSVSEKIPPANAIIHPKMPNEKYPDKTLAGGAVAFKLVQALLKRDRVKRECLPDGQTHEGFEKWMLDLVAMATIGDMVPLIGESRTLARYGLTVFNKTKNLGLQKLLQTIGLTDKNNKSKKGLFDSNTIAFQIVPRLNAAGRIDHANIAFALLMEENPEKAELLAKQLNENNNERQQMTDKLLKEAIKQAKKQQEDLVLIITGEDWPTGLLGLVSGRLKEKFYKPAIVLSKIGKKITGSGRSVSEFNMIKALQSMPEMFEKFGGHPQACGLSLAKPKLLEEFKKRLNEKAKEELKGVELIPQVNVDAVINLEDVDWKLYDLLQKFSPFGQNNEEPKYAAYGLTVTSVDPVGKDGKHLRLMVKHNSHIIRKTIGFGLGDLSRHPADWKNNLKVGDKIDMVFSVGVNEWNGNRELQLTVEDIRKS